MNVVLLPYPHPQCLPRITNADTCNPKSVVNRATILTCHTWIAKLVVLCLGDSLVQLSQHRPRIVPQWPQTSYQPCRLSNRSRTVCQTCGIIEPRVLKWCLKSEKCPLPIPVGHRDCCGSSRQWIFEPRRAYLQEA